MKNRLPVLSIRFRTWSDWVLPATCCVLLLSGLVGCTTAGRDVERASREVADVTTSIKAALIEAEDIDAAAIRIRLKEEAVWLDGFVDSEAEAVRAEEVTRQQVPDRDVVNRIEIR